MQNFSERLPVKCTVARVSLERQQHLLSLYCRRTVILRRRLSAQKDCFRQPVAMHTGVSTELDPRQQSSASTCHGGGDFRHKRGQHEPS